MDQWHLQVAIERAKLKASFWYLQDEPVDDGINSHGPKYTDYNKQITLELNLKFISGIHILPFQKNVYRQLATFQNMIRTDFEAY